jgi:hypothetical protein
MRLISIFLTLRFQYPSSAREERSLWIIISKGLLSAVAGSLFLYAWKTHSLGDRPCSILSHFLKWSPTGKPVVPKNHTHLRQGFGGSSAGERNPPKHGRSMAGSAPIQSYAFLHGQGRGLLRRRMNFEGFTSRGLPGFPNLFTPTPTLSMGRDGIGQ